MAIPLEGICPTAVADEHEVFTGASQCRGCLLDDVVAVGGVRGWCINIRDVKWLVVVAVQLDVLDEGGVVCWLLLLSRWLPNCEVASDEQGDADVVVVRFPPGDLISVVSCSACVFGHGCGVYGCLLYGKAASSIFVGF